MVLITVEVLEVVESMMLLIPVANDDARIDFAVEVLEAAKSWSNLAGDDPLEMMSSRHLRNVSEMKVRVVDQSSFWILCSLMKPDQFATIFWFWKLLQVAVVDGG